MVFHPPDEIPDKPILPEERFRIGEGVQPVHRGRAVNPEGHVAVDQRHDQLHAVLLREIGQRLEPLHHRLIHPGPARFGRRKRPFAGKGVPARIPAFRTIAPQHHHRLKIRPERKYPQQPAADLLQCNKILLHHRSVPLRPHPCRGMARPVVHPERHRPLFQHLHTLSSVFSSISGKPCKTRGALRLYTENIETNPGKYENIETEEFKSAEPLPKPRGGQDIPPGGVRHPLPPSASRRHRHFPPGEEDQTP